MDVKEIEMLSAGDFVRYVGPKRNKGVLVVGRNYEVLAVDEDAKRFEIVFNYIIRDNPFAKEWDLSSYERVKPVVKLQSDDYGTLIDCALATNDYEWFKKLHALAFP